MTQIRLHDVSKHYDDEVAVDGVDLDFENGAVTAVVGPSGSGKSTLLQLINGLVRPTRGRVSVFGKAIDYDHLPELRRDIGYAVQGTGLFPHMTVEGNVSLLARIAAWDQERLQGRLATLMELVGLPPEYRSRYPHELSGGQQQRVGLCRAMMLNPPVFLLDESFGALDPVTRAEIHEEFLHLQEVEPRTIVLVTHDLREALKLSRRLVVLDDGRVAQHGTSDAILNRPESDFVRDFFHSQLD